MEIELFGYFPSIINCMRKKNIKWNERGKKFVYIHLCGKVFLIKFIYKVWCNSEMKLKYKRIFNWMPENPNSPLTIWFK